MAKRKYCALSPLKLKYKKRRTRRKTSSKLAVKDTVDTEPEFVNV
jgi:hypothetical protein